MAGHIVWAFRGVDKVTGILGDEAIEVVLEVHSSGAIRILIDNETGAGVLDEDGYLAGVYSAGTDDLLDLGGDLVSPLPSGADGE
jgi:hypothetical protein